MSTLIVNENRGKHHHSTNYNSSLNDCYSSSSARLYSIYRPTTVFIYESYRLTDSPSYLAGLLPALLFFPASQWSTAGLIGGTSYSYWLRICQGWRLSIIKEVQLYLLTSNSRPHIASAIAGDCSILIVLRIFFRPLNFRRRLYRS